MSQLHTLFEVNQHNGKNGAKTWIVIRDNVYDVTDFLDQHPGGGEVIQDVAGKDCTTEFDECGHSTDAKQMLKKYKIGMLIEQDKRANRKKKTTITAKAVENEGVEVNEVTKRRRRFRFFFCA